MRSVGRWCYLLKKELHDKLVNIWLTDTQYNKVREYCYKHNVKFSQLVRALLKIKGVI